MVNTVSFAYRNDIIRQHKSNILYNDCFRKDYYFWLLLLE